MVRSSPIVVNKTDSIVSTNGIQWGVQYGQNTKDVQLFGFDHDLVWRNLQNIIHIMVY